MTWSKMVDEDVRSIFFLLAARSRVEIAALDWMKYYGD